MESTTPWASELQRGPIKTANSHQLNITNTNDQCPLDMKTMYLYCGHPDAR